MSLKPPIYGGIFIYKGEIKMIYYEKIHDLFKMKKVDVVAQCIAQDCLMGAGIAVTFKRRYPDMQQTLLTQIKQSHETYPNVIIYDGKHNRPPVANLITKPVSFRKPTFEDFEDAIRQFRQVVIDRNYTSIAMPMIGSGLDGLSWEKQVLPTIQKYFYDLDVAIYVCFTEQNARNMNKIKPFK